MGKKKRSLLKVIAAVFALVLMMSNVVLAEGETSIVEDVVVNTTVRTSGHYLESLDVTVSDAAALEGLTAADFTLAGTALAWMSNDPHDFTATVEAVSVNENVLTLDVTDFAEKYFYVQSFTVTCGKDTRLSFTKDNVSKVITPVADEFTQIRTADGGAFDYNLYTPEDTSKAQPIVIAFHGFLDDDNLLQNRLAISWAFDENQADRPCYVMAPLMGGYSYMNADYRTAMYEKVFAEVQNMIAAGKVDPNRVYVVGKSFGGAAVYEYCAKYSDSVAGAIAMCGATNYFSQSDENVAKLVDVPLWITHATTDPTVPVSASQDMYERIVAADGTLVKYTEYSDEDMAAAGVTAAMGNHSMEAVVLEDSTYHEWLFEQNNSAVEAVVANTVVKPAGQTLETFEVTVSDASLLEGLKAEDFSFIGKANGWLTSDLHDFTGTVKEVAVEGNVLTLTVDCPEKFCYVQRYNVICNAQSTISFTKDDVAKVVTPVADDFTSETGDEFVYNLFTPEDTSKAQPLVLTFHGFGDDLNLYQNKLAVAWATPENQADRPCYVMAPEMGGWSYYSGAFRDGLFEKIHAEVQKLVDEGKVDPERIYVVGKSFGGRSVYEYLAKYPEDVTAAIAMCGAMETYFSDPVDFTKLVDIPLWIAHATTDNTVNVEDSRNAYNAIVEAGGTLVHYTEYSDEEMLAAGVTEAMGNHSMEAVVLEDVSYMEWLFSHPEADVEEPGDDVVDEPGDDVEEPGDDAEEPGDDAEEPGDVDVSEDEGEALVEQEDNDPVKTGDTSPIALWGVLAAMAMCTIVTVSKRKQNQ